MLIKYMAPILRNSLAHRSIAPFNILTNKIKQKQQQKRQKQFREEMEHLANKPSFTIMDYKQRTIDQLIRLKKDLSSKVSSEKIQQEKALTQEKTILNAIFEEELVQEQQIKGAQKKEIALVTQIPLEKVNGLLKKVDEYKKMHKLLRGLKQANQPLPENMEELQYLYMRSGLMLQGKKTKYMKYQQKSRAQRYNYLKYGKFNTF